MDGRNLIQRKMQYKQARHVLQSLILCGEVHGVRVEAM